MGISFLRLPFLLCSLIPLLWNELFPISFESWWIHFLSYFFSVFYCGVLLGVIDFVAHNHIKYRTRSSLFVFIFFPQKEEGNWFLFTVFITVEVCHPVRLPPSHFLPAWSKKTSHFFVAFGCVLKFGALMKNLVSLGLGASQCFSFHGVNSYR